VNIAVTRKGDQPWLATRSQQPIRQKVEKNEKAKQKNLDGLLFGKNFLNQSPTTMQIGLGLRGKAIARTETKKRQKTIKGRMPVSTGRNMCYPSQGGTAMQPFPRTASWKKRELRENESEKKKVTGVQSVNVA